MSGIFLSNFIYNTSYTNIVGVNRMCVKYLYEHFNGGKSALYFNHEQGIGHECATAESNLVSVNLVILNLNLEKTKCIDFLKHIWDIFSR